VFKLKADVVSLNTRNTSYCKYTTDTGNIKSVSNLNNRYSEQPAFFCGPLLLKLSWSMNQ